MHPRKPAALAAAVLLACHAHAQNGEDLQAITVKSDRDNTRTEDVNSYTTSAMRTTTVPTGTTRTAATTAATSMPSATATTSSSPTATTAKPPTCAACR